ncbi:hypothetical protein [Pseudoxanthomonas dokdonensis]|uniref:Type II secretion system protein G n=1 Tax=Pseudoxanthomonas dokdonensis TaxID=344882 RepID=A0A0R0CUS2_9GAMM|nr:hypothetical protein [Pseudoxanthomonas dokdonensis]KRG70090.1 hypothetical protein ABB29_07645 [Pseudoxanthomonas dokdonensis]
MTRPGAGSWLLGAAVLVVVAALTIYFATIGSPQLLRQQREDQQRLQDLHRLSIQLEKYQTVHGRLPTSQSDLVEDVLRDPVTGQPYEYLPSSTNPASFRLCASFTAPLRRKGGWDEINGQQRPAQAGRHCFVFETGEVAR